ncbi:hypothetical protein JYU34_015477 [Plutella xylostella]|uniref:Uncharacterized protein n=1 Tax=Plutella xylostella TaxID=51655 RepID=A0ABQ7Q7A7_PLUXY|nr:hypothetical protein JYU34_015477 [Plutella xylostella]
MMTMVVTSQVSRDLFQITSCLLHQTMSLLGELGGTLTAAPALSVTSILHTVQLLAATLNYTAQSWPPSASVRGVTSEDRGMKCATAALRQRAR